jgi:RNA polymerase sigma factor (sigma-70 family)
LRRILGAWSESSGDPDVEQSVVIRHELRLALEAMSALKERDRTLVGLRVGAGLSYADIGRLTGLSERTAMKATHRALDKIRSAVEGMP